MNLISPHNKNKKYNIMLKILFMIIQIITLSYLILILALFLFQNKMIFIPYQDFIATPSDFGLNFEDINFKTKDGTNLNGWFVPAENAEYTVLFCHGNAGNISHRLDTISLFNKLPLNFFIFDYRSYGKSGGSISEKGLYEDVAAAWRYLTETRKIDAKKIIIVGRSLGVALAAHAAEKYSPAGLILESAFSSLPDIAQEKMPVFPVRWMLRYKLSTMENLIKVKCPVLIIASPDDNIIPFSHSEKLFEKAAEPKTFIELSGDHDDCYFLCRAKYTTAITKFLETLF
ncbi:MAG: alpha/beta hydrolase [Victivallales bacterium]|nr:alpha/beta hydrolase [Victivallales bacterium]